MMYYPGVGYPGLYFPLYGTTDVVLGEVFDFTVKVTRQLDGTVAVDRFFEDTVTVVVNRTFSVEVDR